MELDSRNKQELSVIDGEWIYDSESRDNESIGDDYYQKIENEEQIRANVTASILRPFRIMIWFFWQTMHILIEQLALFIKKGFLILILIKENTVCRLIFFGFWYTTIHIFMVIFSSPEYKKDLLSDKDRAEYLIIAYLALILSAYFSKSESVRAAEMRLSLAKTQLDNS